MSFFAGELTSRWARFAAVSGMPAVNMLFCCFPHVSILPRIYVCSPLANQASLCADTRQARAAAGSACPRGGEQLGEARTHVHQTRADLEHQVPNLTCTSAHCYPACDKTCQHLPVCKKTSLYTTTSFGPQGQHIPASRSVLHLPSCIQQLVNQLLSLCIGFNMY